MKMWATPEAKRGFAKAIGTFSVDDAMDWYAAAALQEAGSQAEADYLAARDAWRAHEPQREDFLPTEVQAILAKQRADLEAKAAAEVEKIHGALFRRAQGE